MIGGGRTTQLVWILAAVGIAFAWLYPFPYFELLNNPNENVRVYMTRSIVEDQTFAINTIVEDWGYVNDKAINERGELFPGKAPGTSFLAVPAYWIYYHLSQLLDVTPSRIATIAVCRVSASILPVLAFLVLFARRTARATPLLSLRVMAVATLAVGSTLLPYGLLCTSHSTIAACIFGAYLLADDHRDEPLRPGLPLLSGFLLAWAIALEYPAGIGVLIVALYGIVRSPNRARYIGWNVLGGLLPMALLMYFHWSAFGSPFENAYSNLENPEFRESVSPGFFGMERIQRDALIGSLFAPWNGLFWFMPWTLPATIALPFALAVPDLRRHAAVTLTVLLAYTIFVSMVDNWRGGWTAGPRYIVPVVPFLGWFLLHLLARVARTQWWPLVAAAMSGLVAVSIFNCALSAFVFPHYPESITNPIVEIGLFFPKHGYFPHSAGTLFGLVGWWSLVPPAIAVTVVWAVGLLTLEQLSPTERISAVVVAATLALGIFFLQALPITRDANTLSQTRTVVATIWEPQPTTMHTSLRAGTLPPEVVSSQSSAVLESAARVAAASGFEETAFVLFAAARNRAGMTTAASAVALETAGDAPAADEPGLLDGDEDAAPPEDASLTADGGVAQ